MSQQIEYENPRFKKMGFDFIDEKIFIKKNVLSKDYILQLEKVLSGFSESDWLGHGNYEVGDQPEESFGSDKVSPPIDIIDDLNDSILFLFAPEYWTINHLYMNRLREGEKPSIQIVNKVSNNGEKQFHIDYVATIPVGNWEGGEYFFPKKGITITLEAGDLLVFSGDEEYQIDIQTITKGTKYSSFTPIIKHPEWMIL